MVKDTDASGPRKPRTWHGGLLLVAFGLLGTANACGGRTVWVEEDPTAGEAGDAGTSGYGGDSGGYGGAYGGSYGGAYGGSYGAYGGVPAGGYGGAYGGYGGVPKGGYGGVTSGGAYPTGGTPTGGTYPTTGGSFPMGGTGIGGSYGGTAGVAGKGGCGPTSGAGGSAGSTGVINACSAFCPRFPYASCDSDFEGTRDCLSKCQQRFGLDPWCDWALVDFLYCAASYLDPNAMCVDTGDGQCYGPGCVNDAVNACALEYLNLLECQDSPRPLPPCPPPPNRPVPPGCGLGEAVGPGYCYRETSCPMDSFMTECYALDDLRGTWYCDCFRNGYHEGSVSTAGTMNACYTGAGLCGYY